MSYISEIWGPDVHSQSIEWFNRKCAYSRFCKSQFGVGINTSNPAVLDECERDRVYM